MGPTPSGRTLGTLNLMVFFPRCMSEIGTEIRNQSMSEPTPSPPNLAQVEVMDSGGNYVGESVNLQSSSANC